ncbi:hypothetical protein HanRHA438_Chr08g0335311 [Helianthus annuus]|nr:hypothetical protein HanRHA438_Chr08g0335311 [Helianthus annuus]
MQFFVRSFRALNTNMTWLGMFHFLCLSGHESLPKKDVHVNFLIDLHEGRSTLCVVDVLVFGCASGKHVCVDLTRVSPLFGLRENGFVAS